MLPVKEEWYRLKEKKKIFTVCTKIIASLMKNLKSSMKIAHRSSSLHLTVCVFVRFGRRSLGFVGIQLQLPQYIMAILGSHRMMQWKTENRCTV